MKELLKKLKLIDYLQTELIIQKNDFVNKLRNHVDEGSTGIFSDTFDVFSSSKNEYKGEVSFNGFKIKRRRKFFDMNMNMAVAKGTYSQKDDKLIIDTEINGFHGMMIPFYIFCIIIYGVFIVGFLSADEIGGNAPGFAFPFIIIHAAFMMGIPYFIMKRSTKRLKHELEREFFYLTK
ncbi:hypothetical protein BTO06_12165 [Tenacibaculum sp. SZ-18]|uniref:hypothetical protein n=1 Tax=Tenacibaculum sp. SZ-18 TaxID=754423 RepID=UPI000C2D1C6F|nr:hypothetical protein [Tenacibaculum sp. SZ-18]AUC15859.1 hypothetical protein BTO06_12165 [Tenacibaculum sp. SZ-18]